MAVTDPAPTASLDLHDRLLRLREAAALYLALPALLALALPPTYLLPVLWVAGAVVYIALRRSPTFDRRRLVTWNRWRSELGPMFGRFALAALLLGVALWWMRPHLLFRFPSTRPDRWLLVVVLYPVLSVFPQGLIYRALFLHRHARLFGTGWRVRVAGAFVFSFAHLPFGNAVALLFTFVGGLLFLRTYERTGSLPLSCLEHALYGDLLFTIGWGAYLYHGGTQALLAG